jgi:hypothetical protein
MLTRIGLVALTALCLASATHAAHIAPAPREVKPKDYATAHAEAKFAHMPLVVFVGRDPAPVDGAVVAQWNDYPGVSGPAIVVGYPVGGQLFQECVLACPCESGRPDAQCPVRTGELRRAVENAARKADVRVMPPKPLDGQVRKDGCVCGENCRCAAGECPLGCAAKKGPVIVGYQKVCHGTWCELVPVYR